MIVASLTPKPLKREAFKRNREKMIPAQTGCYVLANFKDVVLYIGLAADLHRRFGQHLDSPEKTGVTPLGIAVFFYWLETQDTNRLERTWMNIHRLSEGKLPVLNSVYSPTST